VVEREADLAAALPGAGRLLVVGGDGTLHRSVNLLDAAGALPELPLALLPIGTGCDFARSVALPPRPRAVIARLLAARPRAIDLLEVGPAAQRRLAVNVASAGISGLVDELVNGKPQRGALAFFAATLRALARFRAVPCRVAVDGEPWHEGATYLLAVANGTSFGKGMRIAPAARLDDGLADVVLVRGAARWQLPFQLPRLYLGTHLSAPFVAFRRAREVRLEPLAPLPPLDLDGETAPAGAATFRVLPGRLRLLA